MLVRPRARRISPQLRPIAVHVRLQDGEQGDAVTSPGHDGAPSPLRVGGACHHRCVHDDASALRVDPEEAAGARLRLRFDWWTFVWIVVAVLGALALLALVSNTTTMLTRIGIGVLIALALDPLVDKLQRRFSMRRGLAVGIVAVGIIAFATLLLLVLGPRAVDEARRFSS